MTPSRLTRTLAVLGAASSLACMALDPFLYAPSPAADDADLFAHTAIAPQLRHEEKAAVRSADDVAVDTWWLSHAADDGTPSHRHQSWVLYCHGNSRNLAAYARRLEAIWQLGYQVVGFDYRGYGKTRGTPDEEGLYADARAVRAWAQAQGAQPAATALYGYSLGSAVCSQLATEAPTPLLVLEAPFASLDRLSRDNSGLDLPRAHFTRARYDTEGKIHGHKGDLLLFHGLADDYLDPRYGRQLAAAAQGHARTVHFVPVAEADHETVPCLDKTRGRRNPGSCDEGFDPAYLATLAAALDVALGVPQPLGHGPQGLE